MITFLKGIEFKRIREQGKTVKIYKGINLIRKY